MNIVDRAKNILLSPRTEWVRIAAEPATPRQLFTGYAMILALLPAIGSIIGAALIGGIATPGASLGIGFVLVIGVLGYLVGLAVLYAMGIIASSLAPSFDGRSDQVSGLKLVVYAATPVWVIGILNFIPALSFLLMLAGFGYAIYLIYLGATPVMAVPKTKAGGYAAVVVIIWFVINLVAGLIIGAVVFAGMMGSGGVSPYGL